MVWCWALIHARLKGSCNMQIALFIGCLQADCCRQELRENSQNQQLHLLLRRWHGCRHREHNRQAAAIACFGVFLTGFTDLVRSGLELHRLEMGTEPRVVTAMTRLFQCVCVFAFVLCLCLCSVLPHKHRADTRATSARPLCSAAWT